MSPRRRVRLIIEMSIPDSDAAEASIVRVLQEGALWRSLSSHAFVPIDRVSLYEYERVVSARIREARRRQGDGEDCQSASPESR